VVKVAFIVEGKVERIFVDHLRETGWFARYGIEKVGPTIDAQGGGNLCPERLDDFISEVRNYHPDKIVILTDQECDPCVQKAKERIGDCIECIVILAKQAIESWFLADDDVVQKLSQGLCSHYENPEQTSRKPFETFRVLSKRLKLRGPGSKSLFVKKVLKTGFDVERAASRAPSAAYFVAKIKAIGGSSV